MNPKKPRLSMKLILYLTEWFEVFFLFRRLVPFSLIDEMRLGSISNQLAPLIQGSHFDYQDDIDKHGCRKSDQ